MRLNETKNADSAITNIFGVNFPYVSRPHGQRIAAFIKKLIRLFIHAPHRMLRIIRKLVDIKNIFHCRYKFGILFRRYAPVIIKVRFEFILLEDPSYSCPA